MSPGRIVVEVEAGTPARELEAAAALAGRVGAELVGLFVEDADLFRFAALPFAREIGFASAARRSIDVGAMERSLQAHAGEARRLLASVAGHSAIRWSFRVERGVWAEALLAAVVEPEAFAGGGEIRLLLLGDGESPATRWAERVRDALAARGSAPQLRLVLAGDLAQLEHALRENLPSVVALGGDEALLLRGDLQSLLRESAARTLILPLRQPRRLR